jgi:hypothetical protein
MNSDSGSTVPCCPSLGPDESCDILDFRYLLIHTKIVTANDRRFVVPVEVKTRFRLERCPGPLAIGDLIFTTTLLPGEKVRLFISDRRTTFSYDRSTQLAYRNVQSSNESFYMQNMSDFLSDIVNKDEAHSSNHSYAHVDGHGEAGVDILGLGGLANMSDNFDANSIADFLAENT